MENPQRSPAEPALVPSPRDRAPDSGLLAQAWAEALVIPPPGVESFVVPGVGRVLGYPDRQADPVPVPRPVVEPLPTWVKATALLMPTGSLSLAVTTWALSHAVAAFEAITAALWAGAGLAGAVGVAALTRRGSRAGGGTVTATATATNRSLLGGKATATTTITTKR